MMKTKVLRKCLFLLSLCLICPVLSAQTMALSEPEPAIPYFTMEELAVVDTATSYLRNAAYAIYLHDGRDSNRQMTILSLSEQERAALSSAAVGCAALRTTEQTADFPETDISDGSLAAMVSSVELHQKEIAWRAYLHAVSNSSYKYFNPYYRVVSIEVEGAIAVIELYEMLDYQYEELENASFEGNPCLLSLVKVEQGWLVLSVEVDDEFYEEYRNTGFDLEEEIAGQEKIREREAQECEHKNVSKYLTLNRRALFFRKTRLQTGLTTDANDETREIYVIVPRYFRDCNGASENYLYADLQPTLTVGTTKTLCGRAYLANSTLTMTVYKPNGTQYGSTFRATNATAVSGSVTFNTAGLWKVEVGGLGLNTYTFVIRVVSS